MPSRRHDRPHLESTPHALANPPTPRLSGKSGCHANHADPSFCSQQRSLAGDYLSTQLDLYMLPSPTLSPNLDDAIVSETYPDVDSQSLRSEASSYRSSRQASSIFSTALSSARSSITQYSIENPDTSPYVVRLSSSTTHLHGYCEPTTERYERQVFNHDIFQPKTEQQQPTQTSTAVMRHVQPPRLSLGADTLLASPSTPEPPLAEQLPRPIMENMTKFGEVRM